MTNHTESTLSPTEEEQSTYPLTESADGDDEREESCDCTTEFLRKRCISTGVSSILDPPPFKDDELDNGDDDNNPFLKNTQSAVDQAENLVRRVWHKSWRVVYHSNLPKWLQDNNFLVGGHRPPLESFRACFQSIFRIHTETGNIWTHLFGCIAFIAITISFLARPSIEIQWQEKAIFSTFFIGAILCMLFSTLFHTVYCHSESVARLFNKLDYCGIALLTIGSFVPWLYYSFYCTIAPKISYITLILVLGTACIVVSMWDKFAQPKFRPVRAGVFIGLGLSGVIPAMHYVLVEGIERAINVAAMGWLVLMAVLYIGGALIYAFRFPERLWPGKFDIWFQSHQIFHVFVVAAAFVHYHGISKIAYHRLSFGECLPSDEGGNLIFK